MAGKILTDLNVIANLTRRNESANLRFRKRVKLLDMSGEELDEIVDETAREVEQRIDCTTCGNCCRTLQIVVDDADIRRLARGLSLSAKELERRYVRTARDGVKHMAKMPCPFLEGNRCSVYEDRPQACRDFPYFHTPGFRQRTFMMLSNAELCPIVYNTLERLKRDERLEE